MQSPIGTNQARNPQAGANIRSLRAARGISQSRLAELMREAGLDHWHQNTVSRVENGRQPVSIAEATALEAILDGQVGTGDVTVAESLGDLSERAMRLTAAELAVLRTRLSEALEQVESVQRRLNTLDRLKSAAGRLPAETIELEVAEARFRTARSSFSTAVAAYASALLDLAAHADRAEIDETWREWLSVDMPDQTPARMALDARGALDAQIERDRVPGGEWVAHLSRSIRSDAARLEHRDPRANAGSPTGRTEDQWASYAQYGEREDGRGERSEAS